MPINVARTYLPPLKDFSRYLKKIWKTRWVTNGGEIEKKLSKELKHYLDVKHFVFVANATLGLQVSIKALDLKGEVITTPYSYVATTSSIVWEGCKPVFVDIDSETLCIDPQKIEKAITKNTSGIVVTHVYGNPCDVVEIKKIANRHNLKILYDAAHAFGVKYKNKGIGEYGDMSVFSFHATKVFHTIQGGGICTNDKQTYKKVDYMIRFGHKTPISFQVVGINARNSDLHAAIGLCQLKLVKKFVVKRKKISDLYKEYLEGLPLTKPKIRPETDYNYAYYPIIFESENQLLKTINFLTKKGVFPRRYFYPSLDTLDYVNSPPMNISRSIAKRIMCLPIYYELSFKDVNRISDIVRKSFRK